MQLNQFDSTRKKLLKKYNVISKNKQQIFILAERKIAMYTAFHRIAKITGEIAGEGTGDLYEHLENLKN